jgi:hypothetical protein
VFQSRHISRKHYYQSRFWQKKIGIGRRTLLQKLAYGSDVAILYQFKQPRPAVVRHRATATTALEPTSMSSQPNP